MRKWIDMKNRGWKLFSTSSGSQDNEGTSDDGHPSRWQAGDQRLNLFPLPHEAGRLIRILIYD